MWMSAVHTLMCVTGTVRIHVADTSAHAKKENSLVSCRKQRVHRAMLLTTVRRCVAAPVVQLQPNACGVQQDGASAIKVNVSTLTSAQTVRTAVANICVTTRQVDTRALVAQDRSPPQITPSVVQRAPPLSIAWQPSAQHQMMPSVHSVPTATMSTSMAGVSMLTNVLVMTTVAVTRYARTKKVHIAAHAAMASTVQRHAKHAPILRTVPM